MLRHYSAKALPRTIMSKAAPEDRVHGSSFTKNSPYKTRVDTVFGAQDVFGSACVCVYGYALVFHWRGAARPGRPCGLRSMLRRQETDSQTFTDMQSSHFFSQKPALVNLHTCRRAWSLSQRCFKMGTRSRS